MIVFCRACLKHYDDAIAWSLCPHAKRPATKQEVDAATFAELVAEFDRLVGIA